MGHDSLVSLSKEFEASNFQWAQPYSLHRMWTQEKTRKRERERERDELESDGNISSPPKNSPFKMALSNRQDGLISRHLALGLTW